MEVGHDRMERLLGLITLLLNAVRPISFREIRETIPDYAAGTEATALRRFERDKAALIDDLGVPIRYLDPDPDEEGLMEGGYALERGAYYLPDLDLSPEEMTALYVAGAAARSMSGFPWSAEVGRALEKIRFAAGGTREREIAPSGRLVVRPQAGSAEVVGSRFATLRDAIARRKRVTLAYRGLFRDEETSRSVDPLGLFLREGVWCLYAHCNLRDALRTFHLDRIESLSVNSKAPRRPDFDHPEDLDLASVARLRPWSYPVKEPVRAKVVLEPRLAFSAAALFGEDASILELQGGRAQVEIDVGNPEAFIEQVLSLRDGATLLGPASLREALVFRLDLLVAPGDDQEMGGREASWT